MKQEINNEYLMRLYNTLWHSMSENPSYKSIAGFIKDDYSKYEHSSKKAFRVSYSDLPDQYQFESIDYINRIGASLICNILRRINNQIKIDEVEALQFIDSKECPEIEIIYNKDSSFSQIKLEDVPFTFKELHNVQMIMKEAKGNVLIPIKKAHTIEVGVIFYK
jgi:hypothetical protein